MQADEALMDEPQQMNESPYDAWIAELTEVGDFGGLSDFLGGPFGGVEKVAENFL